MITNLNIPGLILDLSIVAIVLISAANGGSKGFFRTFISFLGWLISLVVPFVFTIPFRTWLIENTNMDESISAHIAVNLNNTSFNAGLTGDIYTLPKEFQSVEESSIQIVSNSICLIIMTIIAFFILFVVTKIATRILLHIIPEKTGKSTISKVDGFFGFIAGALRGVIFIIILLTAAFPIFSLLGADISDPAMDCIRNSFFANILYFNNPVINILNTL